MQPWTSATVTTLAVALFVVCPTTGCKRKAPGQADTGKQATKPTPQQLKDNPDIHAEIGSFDAVLPDGKGRPWVAVSGVASAKLLTEPSGNRNATSTIKGTRALLYQNGKPAFTLSAPLIVADQKTARVTASGRVNAASEGGPGNAMRKLASDTMIWDMRRSTLVGKGNIRLYDSTGFDIPAASFKADGALARIAIFTNEKPVSGWWK